MLAHLQLNLVGFAICFWAPLVNGAGWPLVGWLLNGEEASIALVLSLRVENWERQGVKRWFAGNVGRW